MAHWHPLPVPDTASGSAFNLHSYEERANPPPPLERGTPLSPHVMSSPAVLMAVATWIRLNPAAASLAPKVPIVPPKTSSGKSYAAPRLPARPHGTVPRRLSYKAIVEARVSRTKAFRTPPSTNDGMQYAQDIVANLRSHAVQPNTRDRAATLFNRLLFFAKLHGIPVIYNDRVAFGTLVAAFVEALCFDNDSAATIHSYISLLYSHLHRVLNQPAFSPNDSLFWKSIKKGLLAEFGSPKNQPPAITAAVLLKIRDGLIARVPQPWDAWIDETWLVILFAYHFTLRPNEFLEGCDLRCGNLSFHASTNGSYLRLLLRLTKGLLRRKEVGLKTEQTVAVESSGRLDIWGPLIALRSTGRLSVADAPIFPGADGGFLSSTAFHKNLRNLCVSAGLAPIYSARGARRGHRTYLASVANVSELHICLLGRWSSLSASLNYQEANDSLITCLPRDI